MSVQKFLSIVALGLGSLSLHAQTAATGSASIYSPKDKWELGLHGGTAFIIGDIDPKPGFGGGVHVRKSLDHIFSVRGTFLYAKTTSENDKITNPNTNPVTRDNRSADLTWMSGSGHVILTLNNLRFNRPYRRVLLNAFLGGGLQSFETDYKNINILGSTSTNGTWKSGLNAQAEAGGNISFRVNSRFNLALEHTLMMPFGRSADLLDGDENLGRPVTTYRDILHYPHLSLNFNLGGKSSSKSEPLYWVNPMVGFQDAIANLEARPIFDPTDADADGVFDAFDQEPGTMAGARVDSRGVTLDSDSDGVADFKDKEPFSPPGYKVDALGVAQIPVEPKITEADVNRIVDAKLANFKLPAQQGLTDWFLPTVHYDLDSYRVNGSEYVKFNQVATVLKQNPSVRVVVEGHTDRSASDKYNQVLSYNRANAAIDFLVTQHGISRDRLVLNYGGESNNLIKASGTNHINRRVEFRVAKGESDMGRPEGPKAGKGPRMSGNRDAGY